MARSFEQRSDCLVFDEPFYASYLLKHGYHHPHREKILDVCESDHYNIKEYLTNPLPGHIRFGFQKHNARNILPEFGTDWFPEHHIFLLRDPKDIILSLQKIIGKEISAYDIDIKSLYNIFENVVVKMKKKPLVINSDDFLKYPSVILKKICDKFDIPFDESMLHWKYGLQDSKLFFSGQLFPYSDIWYGGIKESTGFKPYDKKKSNLPEKFRAILDVCMPIYHKLLSSKFIVTI
jgi:hypothetical protein